MIEYVVATPIVELRPPMQVELDPELAARCVGVTRALGDGLFELLYPVHFKQGERLGLKSIPKSLLGGLRPLRDQGEASTQPAPLPPSPRAKGRK